MVIVSSAPEEVVRPLGEFLGVDDVIATRAAVDANGDYTGELEFYVYGPHKADARAGATPSATASTSPSRTPTATRSPTSRCSAPSGHPVAVNPDRDLARLARAEGWGIENFEHPVRLRDRVPVPAPARRSRWAARSRPRAASRRGGGCGTGTRAA